MSGKLGDWLGRVRRPRASREKVCHGTRQARLAGENVRIYRSGGRGANNTRLRKAHVPRQRSRRYLIAAILKSREDDQNNKLIEIFSNQIVKSLLDPLFIIKPKKSKDLDASLVHQATKAIARPLKA